MVGQGQGQSNQGGVLLERAESDNNNNYSEVTTTGLGSLQCLGCEVFGRWGQQATELVPALAREKCRGLPSRIRRGNMMGLLHRWWGILGIQLQRSVAHAILHEHADLPTTLAEPACPIDKLPIVE